jgi:TP901 family phage tail tape measure protein
VIVRLQADVSQYRNDIRAAGKDTTAAFTSAKVAAKEVGAQSTASQKAMRDLGNQASTSSKKTADASRTATQQAKKDIHELERAQTAIAAAGVLTVGMILKSAADFDQAMSHVQAATHESADNMDLLREAAIDAGARTVFSATEAANGIENLAKAGVSTADILGGALDGALNLAAAGTLAVADAAEITATALTQFQLDGSQASHVADLLAAGAGKAQGEVSDMALALKYAGVPAAGLGVSIEQTAGTIALLAKNGIVGEQAGTSLRGMLSSLTSPSKVAALEMEKLGISVFDARGNFLGLDGVAGQLKTRLGGLTQQERANSLGRIFGNEQLQAANVLYREGAKGVHEWTKQVNDAGYAAETAAIKQDNLKGDAEKLGGALSSLFIDLGEGGQGPLRDLTQLVTDLVGGLDALPGPVKAAALGVLLLGTAAVGLSLAATKIGPPFLAARAQVSTFAKAAITDLRLASLGVGGMTSRLSLLAKGGTSFALLAAASSGLTQKLGLNNTAMLALVGTMFGPWGTAIGASVGAVLDLTHANDNLKKAIGSVNTATDAAAADMSGQGVDAIRQYQAAAADAFAELTHAGEGGNFFEQFAGNARREWAFLTGAVGDYKDAQADADQQAFLSEHRQRFLAVQMGLTSKGYDLATASVEDFDDALKASLGLLDKRDALRNFQAAIDDVTKSIKDNGKSLDITTAKGRDNQDALDGIAKAAIDAASKINDPIERGNFLEGARQALIKAIEQFGIGKQKAKDLANELLDVGKIHVKPTIDVDTRAAMGKVAALRQQLLNLDANLGNLLLPGGPGGLNTNEYNDPSSGAPLGAHRAQGGQVLGAGTSTSDSIPARLSNREYVQPVASVDHYGLGFMEAVRTRTLRLAEGGMATTSGVRRYDGSNFRQVPATHSSRNDVRVQLAAGPVEFTITNWDTGEGYFRGLAVSEIDADASYQSGLKGMRH